MKTDKAGLYSGIGQAITYLAYGADETWLAVPAQAFRELSFINKKVGLPFNIFDTTHKTLIPGKKTPMIIHKKRYVCAFCGQTIVPKKKWLKLHMKTEHDCEFTWEEVKNAIMALRYNKNIKAEIDWYKSHSEEYDW